MKKRLSTTVAAALAAAAVAAALTGCGSSKSAASSVYMETTAAAMDSSGRIAYQSPGMGANSNMAFENETAAAGEMAPANTPTVTGRKLIRNMNLNVETTEFDTLVSGISGSVATMGGYVEQSDVSGNSISSSAGGRYAHIVARVPSDKLDSFITQVEQQGNVTYRSENTQDVTLQYSDIESRKKSLTIEQERLWALLEKADTLESVIALEERLSEIRYQLESFESQLRTFDNQVDYSSVALDIQEVHVFTPTSPDSVSTRIQKGFTRSLESVKNFLVNAFIWLISNLPVLLVLAVVLLIVGLAAHLIGKRKSSGKQQLATKKEEPTDEKKE